MRNPFHIIRERWQRVQWNVRNTRDGRAWAGFLLIIGVALIAFIAMIYGVIIEYKHQDMEPIDNGKGSSNEDNHGSVIWINVKQVAPTISAVMLLSTPGPISEATDIASLQDLHARSIATETIFYTTTVHVTPTHSVLSSSTTPKDSVPISHSLGSPISASATSTNSVMTGVMFCLDTNRPNNVYTPCPYVHTNQPGMVEATAVPGSALESSAGHREVYNPYSTLLKGLLKFIDANRELARGVSRVTQLLVWSARVNAAEFLHPDGPSLAKRIGFCASGGNKLRELLDQLEDMKKKNRDLQEGIYIAQDVIGIQQELLDASKGILDKQRVQIEQATQFKV